MFTRNLAKIINLPFSILILFSTLIIFGSIGYEDLASSIFIPSSSVFRFLPSIITIILFSKIINEDSKKINLTLFCISCLISFLWSFESFFFTSFPIIIFLIFKFNSLVLKNFFSRFSNRAKKNLPRIFLALFLIFSVSIYILFYKKKIIIFL